MNKKLLLTSFVALGFACPAMADTTTTYTSDSFPANGYMEEDYTYQGQATYANTGVYTGSVTADAEYENINYSVAAGSYLTGIDANNDATSAQCTAGNFCPGVQSTTYTNNAFGSTGLQACPNGYTSSAAGATANTDCFRSCSTTDVAHSRGTVNGGVYYDGTGADGVNACVPTDCVDGWHIKNGLNLSTSVGTGEGASRAYINGSDNFTEDSASYGQSFYGITSGDTNAFAVNYGNNGIIHGHAACSTTPGTANWSEPYSFSTESSITDQTGTEGARYCWCHVDGYTPKDGTLQSVSSSWVFNDGDAASDCASDCASYCSGDLRSAYSDGLAFRAALLGSVGASPAMCEANTITINWNGASAEAISANNAGETVYEGDIRTPESAEQVTGKRFIGWKFIKPNQNQGG